MKKTVIALLLAASIFSACKKDPEIITIEVEAQEIVRGCWTTDTLYRSLGLNRLYPVSNYDSICFVEDTALCNLSFARGNFGYRLENDTLYLFERGNKLRTFNIYMQWHDQNNATFDMNIDGNDFRGLFRRVK